MVVVDCLGIAAEYNTSAREVCAFQYCSSCSGTVYQRTNVTVTVSLCILYAVLASIRKPSVGGFCCPTLGYCLWQVKNIVGYLQPIKPVLYGISVVVVAV